MRRVRGEIVDADAVAEVFARPVEQCGELAGGRLDRASTYCAWPPGRWSGITSRRATAAATSTPWSAATSARQRSIPAAVPADVWMRPSLDVQRVRVDVDAREAASAARRRRPSASSRGDRRAAPPRPARTRRCRARRSRAPRASAVRNAPHQRVGGRLLRVRPAGDDDRVRAVEIRRARTACRASKPGLRPDRRSPRRDDEKRVPGVDDVAPVETEDLARDREIERQRALVDHRRDRMHVRKLAIVVPETAAVIGRIHSQ